ncbi:MAG: hypothetical protein RRC34_14215 [Lentisphaeria bacterium]|nr:hypothetical protein [Lentisphaeria bacterium]
MMKNEIKITPTHIVCPGCLEVLSRDDIEGFGACPYCDHVFELNADLEDFLLQPLVKQWVAYTRRHEETDIFF